MLPQEWYMVNKIGHKIKVSWMEVVHFSFEAYLIKKKSETQEGKPKSNPFSKQRSQRQNKPISWAQYYSHCNKSRF
jgi:hypothetical protein